MPQAAGANLRVTVDNGTNGSYVSADQLVGGTYTDAVLQRCGTDRRQQNEPTLAPDPRNTNIWASGANEYCATPTAGDAWAGFYRSTDSGHHWTDSLVPGYNGDTSSERTSSPLARSVAGGALAAGDPVMGWDGNGNLFYMGNNFNRGTENGVSAPFRDNTGTIWVATYAPSNSADSSTDGSKYVRTVIPATNTFGEGSFNDKTNLAVDPARATSMPLGQTFTDRAATRSCSAGRPIMARPSAPRSKCPVESAAIRVRRSQSALQDTFTSAGKPIPEELLVRQQVR